MGWAWRWPGRGRGRWWKARPTSAGLVVAWKSPCVLVGAISSDDTRLRRAASRASASTRKSPITVLAGRTMPHSISPGGPGKLDLEDRLKPTHWLAHFRYYMVS